MVLFLLFPLSSSAQFHLNLGNDSPIRKLQMAEMAVTNLYVDTVDEQKLVEDAIRGMLEKLDPHSSYTTAKETKTMTESLQGSFEGIGVQFNIIEDTLMVIQPTLNGPSEKVGILAGDRIITVNDTSIAGVKMSKEEIMKRLRGKKGTKVKLGVVRRGINDVLTFRVTRDKIPVHTLDAYYMIRPTIGYIRIGSFGATTYDEFMTALDTLQTRSQGRMADLIVYTNGRSAPRQEFRAQGNGRLRTGYRVVVLVNEYSASAAEIVTGALQDQDRAQVVGRRTFGKGLVQRPIEFPDGSMMRLTVAHYYTPSGRCIQKPYVKGEKKEYEEDIEKRFKHGELYSRDSIHFADSLRFETLRLKRTVYGGGGIMPDFFVPLDTTQYTRFHRQLAAKSIIINANLRYIDKHRNQLKRQYATFDIFNKYFQVPQSVIDDMLADAKKQKVEPKDDNELRQTMPMLRQQVKALIARDLWDMSEYFAIINEENHIVKKALDVLQGH